jgi:5'(3')-deoxyribonucleotidase
MVIAVDVDNVICNLQEVVVKLFNNRYGASYTLNDFIKYDVMNVLPTQDGIVMRDMYSEHGLYDKVKPIPGAQEAMRKLINMGHQVYLVTDAIPNTYAEKVTFIQRYFDFIDKSHIVSMAHKHLFKCDILIEDNLDNLLAGHHYERICLNYPWNQSKKDYVYGIHRCYNWDDIMATINKINDLE